MGAITGRLAGFAGRIDHAVLPDADGERARTAITGHRGHPRPRARIEYRGQRERRRPEPPSARGGAGRTRPCSGAGAGPRPARGGAPSSARDGGGRRPLRARVRRRRTGYPEGRCR